MNWPRTMLMVSPEHFDVEYCINPHMLDSEGNLNKVDRPKAQQQWQLLKKTFESTGVQVEVLPGQPGQPDMVFCANQTFPFIKDGEKSLLLSQMGSEERQPEVQHFKSWAQKNNIKTYELQSSSLFEGMGDALWNYETGQIFAGFGFRTNPETYSELEKIVEQKITTFELKDERFYHLDTCLSILGAHTAAFVQEAFTEEGLETLRQSFKSLIEIPIDESTGQLACNMCTTNGKQVILQKGAQKTVMALQDKGFEVIEVDTSEFIKSGGSVFCMKQLLF